MIQWWGLVGHRDQELRMRDDSETDNSREETPGATIGLREERSRISEIRHVNLKKIGT
jgi:hypothetical protein